MRIFNCDLCGQQIYFENILCVNCGSQLGYLPSLDNLSSLGAVDGRLWKALTPAANGDVYRKCQNYHKENVCNWMIPKDDPVDFCFSCRFNEMIPDLNVPENRGYWQLLEVAKRRLIYSLLRMKLPLKNKKENLKDGLAFVFLQDVKTEEGETVEDKKVIIGHNEGRITINVAEANDAIREKMRLDMHEGYRTLLGHFRHEIGHYYWFLLVEKNPDFLSGFRDIFGNEKEDYKKSLENYYINGPKVNWSQFFVSAYASAHPWEDWAESWAHYLHMFDALETAQAWGLSLEYRQGNDLKKIHLKDQLQSFDSMKDQWGYLSVTLNSLNRSMGMRDVYPFVWTDAVIEKLRFINNVIVHFKER